MLKKIIPQAFRQQFLNWLLQEDRHEKEEKHPQHSWWKVMCLTGVDYFSTLGYQPGIAVLAAGSLSPLATLILILLTLFGALPIYRRVAMRSPHGEGSISMLEKLLTWWQGKLLVLCLLGFVATDFIITITLSAADATAHIMENPLTPTFLAEHPVRMTLILIGLLGIVFLKGFREAIGIAVALVVIYLGLNLIVIAVSFYQISLDLSVIENWKNALFAQNNNPLMLIMIAVFLFPKLALGLSGFETGVAVMPLVKGAIYDTEENPRGRVKNTYKLLQTAALIMSCFLICSSFITTLLIPLEKFQPKAEANGRALAYLAHHYLGNGFGTVYDLSTIAILWFAGASAMAGLLNIVPRYLPRYGMAPDWARKIRPLVLVYTAIAFGVTILFEADVDAQGGAYATGVLVLMSSAAFAVTLSAHKLGLTKSKIMFAVITLVFFYTTAVNIIERPDGVKIASFFITIIIISSLISRIWRSTEIRAETIEFDDLAQSFINPQNQQNIRLIAHRPRLQTIEEYAKKEQEVREDNHIPNDDSIIFLEISIADASDFEEHLKIEGVQVGNYQILRTKSGAVPNAIAAILVAIKNQTKIIPHAYFGWPEGNPIQYLMRYLLFGEGDIAVLTREVLRRAEADPENRPAIHVGG